MLIKYPLDLLGTSPNNLVQNEEHQFLHVDEKLIVPKYGTFYENSIEVRDYSTNSLLIPRVDYAVAQLDPLATSKSGLAAYSLIILINPIYTRFRISYQAVGGEHSLSSTAIQELLDALENDNRPITWGMLVGVPSEFPAAPHNQHLDTITGWENIVLGLERIHDAIIYGDIASHQAIYDYIDQVVSGGLLNYASQVEAETGENNSKIMTPLRVYQAIAKFALLPMDLNQNLDWRDSKAIISNAMIDMVGNVAFVGAAMFPSAAGGNVQMAPGPAYVRGIKASISGLTQIALPAGSDTKILWLKIVDENIFTNRVPTISFEYEDYAVGTASITSKVVNDPNGYRVTYYARIADVVGSTASVVDRRVSVAERYPFAFKYKNPSNYIGINNASMEINSRSRIEGNITVKLPSVTGISTGDWVEVEKGLLDEPTIVVDNTGTTNIRLVQSTGSASLDTSLLFNVQRLLRFVYIGGNWELIYV